MTMGEDPRREVVAEGTLASSVPGLVRRARRRARLSQRQLADRLGVSQSVVARWETGRRTPGVEHLEQVMHLAGLRLVVLDQEASSVEPMSEQAMRDRGGRRYPAHADVRVDGWWCPRELASTADWSLVTQRSRELRQPQVRYSTGGRASLLRELLGASEDHPTRDEAVLAVLVLEQHRDERLGRRRRAA